MSEAMFFVPDVEWQAFEPFDILALRAYAPDGVFTLTGKGGYLTQVGGNANLTEIADAVFAEDYEFLANLPAQWRKVRPQLVQLTQLAYKAGIRSADSRVKTM